MSLIQKKEKKKIIFGMLLMCVLLVLSVFIPGIIKKSNNYSFEFIYLFSRILIWLSLFVMIWYANNIEKNKFLLWAEKSRDFKFIAIAIISLLGILFIGTTLINLIINLLFHPKTDSSKLMQMLQLFKEHYWILFFTTITAGITEELLFRGYLQSRLQLFFSKPFWPIFISSLIFGMIHIGYGTIIQVVAPFFIGAVFASFYFKYRNLKFLIVFHFIWDLISVFVLMKAM